MSRWLQSEMWRVQTVTFLVAVAATFYIHNYWLLVGSFPVLIWSGVVWRLLLNSVASAVPDDDWSADGLQQLSLRHHCKMAPKVSCRPPNRLTAAGAKQQPVATAIAAVRGRFRCVCRRFNGAGCCLASAGDSTGRLMLKRQWWSAANWRLWFSDWRCNPLPIGLNGFRVRLECGQLLAVEPVDTFTAARNKHQLGNW